ncbi:MAG TPA: hypothetical protein VGO09_06295, partial [Flavisolibacter sp.]|nr:hypothetical protein [Flavisolibacter sp.]
MKSKNILVLLATVFFMSAPAAMAPTESYDPDLEDFTIVEVKQEPAKKAKATIQDVKNMMTKTEKKINQVKDLVESDELKGMAKTLNQMKRSLHKMLFKNGPGFEIVNKTNEPIWVTTVNGNTIKTNQKLLGRDQILPNEKFTMEINDLKQDMQIAIYLNDPSMVSYSSEEETFIPAPDYLYATTAGAHGKTKYFTWNPAKHNQPSKYLYPQTGRLGGLAKVSSSKYS